jgi:hypothetical protein
MRELLQMINSTAKKILIYIALFYLSGCAEGGSGSGSGSGSDAIRGISGLKAPSVSVVTNGSSANLSWDNSNADQYRVLYWEGNNAPQEYITSSMGYTLPTLGLGIYTVIVEAYDELGNSLFSTPVTLEVL